MYEYLLVHVSSALSINDRTRISQHLDHPQIGF